MNKCKPFDLKTEVKEEHSWSQYAVKCSHFGHLHFVLHRRGGFPALGIQPCPCANMQSIRENIGQAVYSELQTAPQFPLIFVETNSSSIALTSPFVSDSYSCKENISQGLQGETIQLLSQIRLQKRLWPQNYLWFSENWCVLRYYRPSLSSKYLCWEFAWKCRSWHVDPN